MAISIDLTVEFGSPEMARRFVDALTGADNDVVLAMEKAAQKKLGSDDWEDVRVRHPGNKGKAALLAQIKAETE